MPQPDMDSLPPPVKRPRPDPQAYADVLIVAINSALAPFKATLAAVQDQVKGFEARWSDQGALRERLAVVESKVDQPIQAVLRSDEPDLTPVLERLAASEQANRDLQARVLELVVMRDRLVAVETKAAVPSPEPAPVDFSPVLMRLAVKDAESQAFVAELARLAVAHAALYERVTVAETKALPLPPEEGFDDLRERIVGLEAKAAGPSLSDMGLIELRTHLATVQAKVFDVSERVAVVETRPLLPGPQGEPGPPGTNGIDGKDGTAGLSFEGVYQDGKSYELGHLVTWAGSSWHCNEPTTTKPGDGSRAWTLMVKRGRDGKDGTQGSDGKPGRDLTEKAAWPR